MIERSYYSIFQNSNCLVLGHSYETYSFGSKEFNNQVSTATIF